MTQNHSGARLTGQITRAAARALGLSALRALIGLLALALLLLHALTPA